MRPCSTPSTWSTCTATRSSPPLQLQPKYETGNHDHRGFRFFFAPSSRDLPIGDGRWNQLHSEFSPHAAQRNRCSMAHDRTAHSPSGRHPRHTVTETQPPQQMADGLDRMDEEHPRSGIAHHLTDLRPAVRRIAVDRAALARRFGTSETAQLQTPPGILPKARTGGTGHRITPVVRPAVKIDHLTDHSLFSCYGIHPYLILRTGTGGPGRDKDTKKTDAGRSTASPADFVPHRIIGSVSRDYRTKSSSRYFGSGQIWSSTISSSLSIW